MSKMSLKDLLDSDMASKVKSKKGKKAEEDEGSEDDECSEKMPDSEKKSVLLLIKAKMKKGKKK